MRDEAASRVVVAGLPPETAEWLQRRLGPVEVCDADDAETALRELEENGSLLIINHTLSGLPAFDVLSKMRSKSALADIPVIYLLDRHLDNELARRMVEQLGVTELMLHPIDREQVAVQAARLLHVPLSPARPPLPLTNGEDETPRWQGDEPQFVGGQEHAYLLIVDDDQVHAESIASEARERGMRVEIAQRPSAAQEIIADERPDLVLLDLAFPKAAEDGLSLLKQLNRHVPPVPVLVLTARDTFIDRVQVASLGGRGFLQKTVPPSEVLDAVARFLQQLGANEGRVMAVDDDPEVLAGLKSVLEPEGINLVTVEDPLRFWETLEQSTPDLLMIDLDMPRLSGIELCRVVRNDARWSSSRSLSHQRSG
jgi:DNA-binding response OmpR family regulator